MLICPAHRHHSNLNAIENETRTFKNESPVAFTIETQANMR
jgi:hypothetical protein